MSFIHLDVSPSQRDLLIRVLSAAQKEKRVEVHRATFSREFRDQLEAEETLLAELLDKLSQSTGSA